jgi:hypothetical protein
LEWVNSNLLLVKYLKADNVRINIGELTLNGQLIKINLKEGVYDSLAPSGGMEYNKRKANLDNG